VSLSSVLIYRQVEDTSAVRNLQSCSSDNCISTTPLPRAKTARPGAFALTKTGYCKSRVIAIDLTFHLPPLHFSAPPLHSSSFSHRDFIKQTIPISENHDVPYLLDASLAREQLDSSSAASARKGQSLILSRRFTKLSINKQTTLPPQQRRQIGFICDLPRD
jgi:hypothetical protein